ASYAADSNLHTMQLLGSNFVSGDTLTFFDPQGNVISNARTPTYASGSEIDYQFNDSSDAGTWQVRVNSADGTLHSAYISFTVAATQLTPSLSSVSPASYAADSSLHTMPLLGGNFVSGDTLTFLDPQGNVISNARMPTYVSGSEIDYQFNDSSDAGTWQVQVNSADGTLRSAYISFTVAATQLTPSLSSVSPASYAADSSLHTMPLLGGNFVSGDTLTFLDPQGDVISNARTPTYASGSEIDYQFNDSSDAGTWHVQVNSADGTLRSAYISFTVAATQLTPSLSSVSPASYAADSSLQSG